MSSRLKQRDIHNSASVRGGSGGSSAPLDFENGIIAPLNFEGNFQYKIMCTKIWRLYVFTFYILCCEKIFSTTGSKFLKEALVITVAYGPCLIKDRITNFQKKTPRKLPEHIILVIGQDDHFGSRNTWSVSTVLPKSKNVKKNLLDPTI